MKKPFRIRFLTPKTTKFPHLLWHWTLGSENLFHMDPADLYTYTLLCQEANQ